MTSSSNGGIYPPLTTLWTRPTSCHLNWAASESGQVTATFESSCYPPTSSNAVSAVASPNRYSPGLCPNGFSTARTEDPSISTITTAMCCTNGYTYSGVEALCKQTVTTPTTILSTDPRGQTSTVVLSSFVAQDSGIFVLFQTSDIDLIITANASYWLVNPNSTTSSGATPTPTLPDALVPTLPTQGDRPSGTNGLTTGAQAGIGIGIGLGALLLLAFLIWMWRRRRQQRVQGVQEPGVITELGGYPQEDGDGGAGVRGKALNGTDQVILEDPHEMAPAHGATTMGSAPDGLPAQARPPDREVVGSETGPVAVAGPNSSQMRGAA